MKLWQKDKTSLKEVEAFTVGNDREMDRYLAAFDVLGSLAHIKMLEAVGLLTAIACEAHIVRNRQGSRDRGVVPRKPGQYMMVKATVSCRDV